MIDIVEEINQKIAYAIDNALLRTIEEHYPEGVDHSEMELEYLHSVGGIDYTVYLVNTKTGVKHFAITIEHKPMFDTREE